MGGSAGESSAPCFFQHSSSTWSSWTEGLLSKWISLNLQSRRWQFAGTRWQALVFSSCRSTFSSPSPPTSRARGSWCAFRTPLGAVDLGGSCARRSCRTTRGVRAASRRGRSGRCILRHTVSWNSCLPVLGRDWRGGPPPPKNCQNDQKLYKVQQFVQNLD